MNHFFEGLQERYPEIYSLENGENAPKILHQPQAPKKLITGLLVSLVLSGIYHNSTEVQTRVSQSLESLVDTFPDDFSEAFQNMSFPKG